MSLFPRHQVSTHDTLDTHSVISTQAVPTNIFASGGGFVEFSLPRLSKKIDRVTLEFKITNSNSGGTTAADTRAILAAVQAIDHIEYFAGTSFLMATDYLAMRLKEILCKTNEHIVATSKYSNAKVDTGTRYYNVTDATIAPLETKTFYVNVTECFHSLIPSFLNEDLRMRVHFAKESAFSGLNTGLVLAGTRLLVEACNLHPDDLDEVQSVYGSNKMSVRYYEPRTQRVPITLSASSTYQVNLQNFFGNFVSLWVLSQTQGATLLNGLASLGDFNKLWLTNSSNEVMFGGLIHDAEWLKYSASRFYPSSSLGSANVFAFNASMNPNMDIQTGTHHGSFALHAKGEALNFSTGSVISGTGARQVVLIGWHASCLRIQNGTVVVLR